MNTSPDAMRSSVNTISLESVRAPIKPGGTSNTRWVVPTLYIVFLLLPIWLDILLVCQCNEHANKITNQMGMNKNMNRFLSQHDHEH